MRPPKKPPIDDVPIEGVPIEGVPIEGVPLFGVTGSLEGCVVGRDENVPST